jgi:antitoxin CcdA
METGKRRITTGDLENLSRVYGVPVTALYAPPALVRARRPAVEDKTIVPLSVDKSLLKAANDEGIDLSEALAQALSGSLKRIAQDRWLAENREAIEYYNEYVAKHGVFSDGRRRF